MAGPTVSMERAAVMANAAEIDYGDIQAVVRFGHGKLTEACFLLLEIQDSDAARAWLRTHR